MIGSGIKIDKLISCKGASIFSNGFQNPNNDRISADPPTHPPPKSEQTKSKIHRLLNFIIINSIVFTHDTNVVNTKLP